MKSAENICGQGLAPIWEPDSGILERVEGIEGKQSHRTTFLTFKLFVFFSRSPWR